MKVDIQQLAIDQHVCTYDFSPSYLNFLMYSILIISILILLILIILSILAFKNVRRIRADPSHTKRNQIRTMNKKDFQLLRCLYVHNIVYIIGSLIVPVSICYTVTLDYQRATPLQFALNNFLNDMSTFIHSIPYCTSFFIFIGVSKAFRQELKRMSYTLCGKNLVIVREEENQQPEAGRENIDLDTLSPPHP